MNQQERSELNFEKAAGIATITINRPRVYNAVREQTFRELIEAFTDATDDGIIGVIVPTGRGNYSQVGEISPGAGGSLLLLVGVSPVSRVSSAMRTRQGDIGRISMVIFSHMSE